VAFKSEVLLLLLPVLLLLLPSCSRRAAAAAAAAVRRPRVEQEVAVFAELEESTVWLALSEVRVLDTSTPPRGSPRAVETSQR